FLIFYPSEVETLREEHLAPSVLPRGLQADRIVFDLEPMPFEDALRTILDSAISDQKKRDSIASILVEGERDFSTEVRPGIVVPHARVSGIEEPVLFLGTCPAG